MRNLIFRRVTLLPVVRGGMDTGRVFAFALWAAAESLCPTYEIIAC
ncbi:hypothetical protein QCM80_33855 [Bradyrhizobium sp. SSUT112]|nr:hypothetical protein [Bradyrhizobium sp. SSUT112]MDH2355620.1 hypothetical protein [Bradyrhizobium sp. SSUT112]